MRLGQLCSQKGNVWYQREVVLGGERNNQAEQPNIRAGNQLYGYAEKYEYLNAILFETTGSYQNKQLVKRTLGGVKLNFWY